MIFSEKRIRAFIDKELASLQIRQLEAATIRKVVKDLEPHISGVLQSDHTIKMVAKRIAFDLDENVKTLVSNVVDNEGFIDDIVSRIKKKQL